MRLIIYTASRNLTDTSNQNQENKITYDNFEIISKEDTNTLNTESFFLDNKDLEKDEFDDKDFK